LIFLSDKVQTELDLMMIFAVMSAQVMTLGDCQEASFASQHLDEKWTTRGGFKFSLETLVCGENQKSINENTAKTQRIYQQ
jgi:hypothetical protein